MLSKVLNSQKIRTTIYMARISSTNTMPHNAIQFISGECSETDLRHFSLVSYDKSSKEFILQIGSTNKSCEKKLLKQYIRKQDASSVCIKLAQIYLSNSLLENALLLARVLFPALASKESDFNNRETAKTLKL